MSLIQPLNSSEIDVIGDVHGEIDALRSLLAHLGYDHNGNHPENRKLVFVGDLIDRGPDSIAVIHLVQRLIKFENAQTILGNHELNLLIPAQRSQPSIPWKKHGNHWFHGLPENMLKDERDTIQQQRLATASDRSEIQRFLQTLPIALENNDIRIVHACWDTPSITIARQHSGSVVELLHQYEDRIQREASEMNKQEQTLAEQNHNPVKILTSGKEEPSSPYWAGGKERITKRCTWWNDYQEEPFVVFGHYWRKLPPSLNYDRSPIPENKLEIGDKKNIPPLFDEAKPFGILGPRQNCMCVDYSVGKRFWERHNEFPLGSTGTALGALRFHNNGGQRVISLLFDNGQEKFLTKK